MRIPAMAHTLSTGFFDACQEAHNVSRKFTSARFYPSRMQQPKLMYSVLPGKAYWRPRVRNDNDWLGVVSNAHRSWSPEGRAKDFTNARKSFLIFQQLNWQWSEGRCFVLGMIYFVFCFRKGSLYHPRPAVEPFPHTPTSGPFSALPSPRLHALHSSALAASLECWLISCHDFALHFKSALRHKLVSVNSISYHVAIYHIIISIFQIILGQLERTKVTISLTTRYSVCDCADITRPGSFAPALLLGGG